MSGRTITLTNHEGQQFEVHDSGKALYARYLPLPGHPTRANGSPAETLWQYFVPGEPTPALVYDVLAHVMRDPQAAPPDNVQGTTFHHADPLTPAVLRYWAGLAEGHTKHGGTRYSNGLIASVRIEADRIEREQRIACERVEREQRQAVEFIKPDPGATVLARTCPATRAQCDRPASLGGVCQQTCGLEVVKREVIKDMGEQRTATMQLDAEHAELVKLAHETLDNAIAKLPPDALRALLKSSPGDPPADTIVPAA